MKGVYDLAAVLCVSAVFCAAVEYAFPEGNLKPVISAVLSLYILLSAFRGAKAEAPEILAGLARAAESTAQTQDYSEYALSLYRESLAAAEKAEEGKKE